MSTSRAVVAGSALATAVATALAEDLGVAGDVTSAATVPAEVRWRAAFVARDAGVLAGVGAVAATYAALDADDPPGANAGADDPPGADAGADDPPGADAGPDARVACTLLRTDGDRLGPGDVVAQVEGPARTLLAGERTALNLLTHLSGVATLTARYVEAVRGTGVAVRDTRKTLPGLRLLQKAAVTAGGGANHRVGLFDALLVKDNHAAASGGIGAATRRALAQAGDLDVQVEVDSLGELEEALAAGARAVLLDNFGLDDLARAVARCRRDGRVFVEASGGIDLETVAAVASTGVDAVAVGALTHSTPALDIGLDFLEV